MKCLASLCLCLLTCRLAGAEPLRTARAVQALPVAEAEQARQVALVAQVIYHDAKWGVLFVTDDTGGVYVDAKSQARRETPWPIGHWLKIQGVSGPGDFLPVVLLAEIESLGPADVPVARVIDTSQALFHPALDSQWVQLEAVVKRFAEEADGHTIILEFAGQRINALLPRHLAVPELPMHWIEKRVLVRGVATTQFNNERQMTGRTLFVPNLECVAPTERLTSPGPPALREVTTLLQSGSPPGEYVRVRGTVLHSLPERLLYLRGTTGSMMVESALTENFPPGTELEAEGYVSFAPFRPALNATALRPLGQAAPPEPVRFFPKAERRSAEQYELVTLEATLVEILPKGSGEAVLVCRAEATPFEAALRAGGGVVPALEPGAQLRLTGICHLDERNPLGLPRLAASFHLTLRSVADIAVLERAPYWNARRLNYLLAGVGGLTLLVASWAYTLRRRVHAQAEIIERQTGERVTLEERQRIARELHDTLEQELLGVSMLLDTTSSQIENGAGSPQATLEMARELLTHSREESRSTIRDLRSVTIEQLGLIGAMDSLLRPLAESAGLRFELAMEGRPRRLGGAVESALLRIGHEAVANAARHSGGTRVEVWVSFATAETVRMRVTDDGVAGCVPPEPSAGHFGISGMKERASRIGARLRFERRADGGTCVSLEVPASAPHAALSPATV